MPGGDGTGPLGKGPRTGRGTGRGMGTGLGGNNGNARGAGAGGYCICKNCGTRLPHQVGTPCYSINCPKCGTKMSRE